MPQPGVVRCFEAGPAPAARARLPYERAHYVASVADDVYELGSGKQRLDRLETAGIRARIVWVLVAPVACGRRGEVRVEIADQPRQGVPEVPLELVAVGVERPTDLLAR